MQKKFSKVGFKKSYLRPAFWRANALIVALLGIFAIAAGLILFWRLH